MSEEQLLNSEVGWAYKRSKMKATIKMHYGKCRIQCFGSMTHTKDESKYFETFGASFITIL